MIFVVGISTDAHLLLLPSRRVFYLLGVAPYCISICTMFVILVGTPLCIDCYLSMAVPVSASFEEESTLYNAHMSCVIYIE
jgi:hypothetical protein